MKNYIIFENSKVGAGIFTNDSILTIFSSNLFSILTLKNQHQVTKNTVYMLSVI